MYLTTREASRELQISAPSVHKSIKTGRTSCGVLFRKLEGPYRLVTMVDQLSWVIDELKKNPFSRRLVVTAWNPANSHKVALETCHCLFQFFVEEADQAYRAGLLFENGTDEQWFEYRSFQRDDVRDLFLTECGIPRLRLSCQLYQRSDKSALAA
ncbi:MAG: hypothetical protein E6R03_04590 [Hyphomicrobiaceae bacterium]|nr:MAG: hypothetical protein E6R03_04590 [Hyphomicrobiaceae bacterium]